MQHAKLLREPCFLAIGRSLEALGITPAIGCARSGDYLGSELWTDRVAHLQVSAGNG